ncbi:hypothetical protein VUR80DRAFT_944 [Thermomyces stellatus]
MAVLSTHRVPPLPGALEAANLKIMLRSLNNSAKSKVNRLLLPRRSTKSCHGSAVDALTTTTPANHTQGVDNGCAYSDLPPSPTCVSDTTTSPLPAPMYLDSEKTNKRDSAVALPPEHSTITRDSIGCTWAAIEKDPHPEDIHPCFEVVPSQRLDRTSIKKSAVVAVRALSKSKCSSILSTGLSPMVLEFFLNSAMEWMKAALHLHRGRSGASYNSKGVLYYSEVLAGLRILSKSYKVNRERGDCCKALGVCESFSGILFPRLTVLPKPLDPVNFPITGDSGSLPHFPRGEASDHLVSATPNREHAPNQGKRLASTERSGSNNHKRSRTSRKRPGEELEHQRRGIGGKGGRDNDEDNDSNKRGTEPYPSEYSGDEGKLTFACPFYKHDPITHRWCLFRHTSTKTNHVKQHLRRRHLAPRHCPICGQRFNTEEESVDHIRRRGCVGQEFHYDGLTEHQEEELNKIPRSETPKERWYRMWDIIFPGETRPASPYVKDPWIEVVETHASMWAEQGGPDRALERENIVLLRPHHVAQDQNSASSDAGVVWQAFAADMIASVEKFVAGNHKAHSTTGVGGAQASPQVKEDPQSNQPRMSPPKVPPHPEMWLEGPQGGPMEDIMPEAYGWCPETFVNPAYLVPFAECAYPMDPSLSHKPLLEQMDRIGSGISVGKFQRDASSAGSVFREAEGPMQEGAWDVPEAGQGQGGLGNSFGNKQLETQGGFAGDFGGGGILTSPEDQAGWGNSEGHGQGGAGSDRSGGGQEQAGDGYIY